jgi:hypothetical protein
MPIPHYCTIEAAVASASAILEILSYVHEVASPDEMSRLQSSHGYLLNLLHKELGNAKCEFSNSRNRRNPANKNSGCFQP